MSHRNLSDPQFQAVLSDFRDRTHGDYSDPIHAANSCQDASEHFQIFARQRGVRDVGRMTVEHPNVPPPRDPNTHLPGTPGYNYGHTVNTVRGHVVDWTARQFDPTAKFPHIEPVQAYRARYGTAYRD